MRRRKRSRAADERTAVFYAEHHAPWNRRSFSGMGSRETLIQSQSRISHGFLYMASSSSSLNSLLFASDDSSLCIKIQE